MASIFSLLYNLLLYLFCIPFLIYFRTGLWQRLGFVPEKIQEGLAGKKVIWIHAASVGEVIGASAIIRQLKEELPEYTLLLSTITPTGKIEAEKLLPEVIFCPVDIGWAVRRAINIIKPGLLVVLETELWPNLLAVAKRANCKIMVANGRLSSRNIKRYLWIKPLMKRVLANVDLFSMQSQEDANRIISSGAPRERVKLSGSCKFDLGPVKDELKLKEELAMQLHLNPEDLVIVAGSTREGEEEILLEAFKLIHDKFEHSRLIIAPRHLKRVEEIEKIINRVGLTSRRRTIPHPSSLIPHPSIIILDTLGELRAAYSLAHICFVGGSLVPIGGHNVLEPASLGKVVLFGKFVDNCKEAALLLLVSGGGIQVESATQLAMVMGELLKNPEGLKNKGQAAKKVVESHQGASQRNVQLAKTLIENS